MRSFCIHVVGAVVSSVLAMGCAQSGGQCSRPVGAYKAAFTPVSGNCTQFMSRDLTFEANDEEVTVLMMKSFGDLVVTEVNLIGCTVAVKQQISDPMGVKLIASLKGDLDVQDDTALTGRFDYREFMPDGTTQRCASYVDVSYTLMENGTLGAAAQSVLTAQ
jgi:hypothetical protein